MEKAIKAYVSIIKHSTITGVTFGHIEEAFITDYTNYYSLIGCSTFDVVMIEYKGEPLSLYIDDEGLLKPNMVGRHILGYPNPLFGNIVICGGVDRNGDTLSVPEWFTKKDVEAIIGNPAYLTNGGE